MTHTYLKDTDLAARYGVSRNTIWRWARDDSGFPQPVRLSPCCTRWQRSQVEAWEVAQSASRDDESPCKEGAA